MRGSKGERTEEDRGREGKERKVGHLTTSVPLFQVWKKTEPLGQTRDCQLPSCEVKTELLEQAQYSQCLL